MDDRWDLSVARQLARLRDEARDLRAENENLRRLLDRHGLDIDGPPRLRDEVTRAHARLDIMSDPDKPGFYDNLERGFSALLSAAPGRILAASVLILALGAAVVVALLAWKGDLDDVIRGAVTPGAEIEAVTPDSTRQ